MYFGYLTSNVNQIGCSILEKIRSLNFILMVYTVTCLFSLKMDKLKTGMIIYSVDVWITCLNFMWTFHLSIEVCNRIDKSFNICVWLFIDLVILVSLLLPAEFSTFYFGLFYFSDLFCVSIVDDSSILIKLMIVEAEIWCSAQLQSLKPICGG